jgi:mycothiol system anti-sigma-R factor
MTIVGLLRGWLARKDPARSEARSGITCSEALAALQAYLDGRLTGDDHDRVKAHLDVCARCYPRLRLEKSFRLAVQRAARGERASPALRGRLQALLREAALDD